MMERSFADAANNHHSNARAGGGSGAANPRLLDRGHPERAHLV